MSENVAASMLLRKAAEDRRNAQRRKDDPHLNGHSAPYTIGLRRADTIAPREVEWLWPGRIPFGKITIVAGDAGVGKSAMMCDVSARASAGGGERNLQWPDKAAPCDPINVLYLSCEDDPEDTLVPRLAAAQADMKRIHFVGNVENSEGGSAFIDTAIHSGLLAETLRKTQARLLVIDVLAGVAGGRDINATNEMRTALQPLKTLAEEQKAAIVVIHHLNKSSSMKALHRIAGSATIGGIARSVIMVGKDPHDDELCVMGTSKMSIERAAPNITYRIKSSGPFYIGETRFPSTALVSWQGAAKCSLDEALGGGAPDTSSRSKKRQEVLDWLRTELTPGRRVSVTSLYEIGRGMKYSERTIRRAFDDLGTVKTFLRDPDGENGRWMVHRNGQPESPETEDSGQDSPVREGPPHVDGIPY